MNPPECLLKISGIDKTFPGVKALTQASLSVYAGQAMALIGENGAGKSTLMKVLTGIYTKDAGSIEYLGREVAFRNPRESQQAGISIIHQELNLIGELSIAENIFLGREPLTRFGIDWKKLYRDADALLARLSFPFASDNPNIRRLLGLEANGADKLGVGADFCAKIIKHVGNYGEAYDRNVGKDSPLNIERGLNRLWNQGGIMFAPPLR